MTEPRLSRLQRVVQKLGLEEVIPDLAQASDGELLLPFYTYLSYSECHEDLGISENLNPAALPSVPFTEVKVVAENAQTLLDSRSPLMEPYFSTMSIEEMESLMSQDSLCPPLVEPPLDTDDFLGCRLFFKAVAEAVELGFHTVSLDNKEHTVSLIVHIEALRMLNAVPNRVQTESKETVLLQVEYCCMSPEDHSKEDYEKILSDLMQQYPTGKKRIVLGTEHQIYFILQVLQAHEHLLEKSVISEHEKEWSPREKSVRPSFIVPLRTLADSNCYQEILQEIKSTATILASKRAPNNAFESENKDLCAVCGKTNVKLKKCSECKSIKYCTRECQISDWPAHKQTCRAVGSDLKWSRLWPTTSDSS